MITPEEQIRYKVKSIPCSYYYVTGCDLRVTTLAMTLLEWLLNQPAPLEVADDDENNNFKTLKVA